MPDIINITEVLAAMAIAVSAVSRIEWAAALKGAAERILRYSNGRACIAALKCAAMHALPVCVEMVQRIPPAGRWKGWRAIMHAIFWVVKAVFSCKIKLLSTV